MSFSIMNKLARKAKIENAILRQKQAAKSEKKRQRSLPLTDLFLELVHRAELPPPSPEVKFCDSMNYRLDFGWLGIRLAVEIQGGLFFKNSFGGHNSISGILRDIHKLNLALSYGWIVLFVHAKSLRSEQDETITLLRECYDLQYARYTEIGSDASRFYRGTPEPLVLPKPARRSSK